MDKEVNKGCNIHIVGGDFNARLIQRSLAESKNFGPWIFNPQGKTLDILSKGQLENSELFAEFRLGNNFLPASTWFQKSMTSLVTFRSTRARSFEEELSTHKFTQMDFVLFKDTWKNICESFNASTQMPFKSDHKATTVRVCMKLKKKQKDKKKASKASKFVKPNEEQAK